MPTTLRRLILPLLLAAAILPYFVDLGGSSIWDANEAYYVETPREMMDRGDYVFPMWNYEPRLNKPVLSYWMVIGLYKMFGVSVGVERIGIAIAGMLIIAAAFVLGGLLSHRRFAWPAALLAATGLAVDPRLFMFARRIFIDMWISAFMVLTLVLFALSERMPERRRLFLVLMYVSAGLGVLTKGPIAVLLPGLVFAAYLLAHGELKRATQMMIPAGILIVLAIVVPWYFQLYQRDGWKYIVSFFVGENVGRFTSGIGQQEPRSWYFYAPVVFGDSLPLSLFLVPAAMLWWRTRERMQTLLWLWIVLIVVFFSFSHDKQDLYIFPIAPAVAALAAAAIVRRDEIPKSVWIASAVLGILVAALGAAILFLFERGGRVYSIEGARAVGLLALGGGIAAFALGASRRVWGAVVSVLITFAAVNWLLVLRVLPDFERYKPVPALSDYLRPMLEPDDRIAHFNVALPSMVYYLRHHVDPYYSPDEFVRAMHSNARVFGMVRADDYALLEPRVADVTCVLHRVPTFDVKLKNILAQRALPEIVLITNRCGEPRPGGQVR